MKVWEGGIVPFHGTNEGLTFTNIVNTNHSDGKSDGDGDDQRSNGHAAHSFGLETQRCYYCKYKGHLKPDFPKLKVKQAAKEAKNTASRGAYKADGDEGGLDDHTHTMLIKEFENFNTGAEDHLLFSNMV